MRVLLRYKKWLQILNFLLNNKEDGVNLKCDRFTQ